MSEPTESAETAEVRAESELDAVVRIAWDGAARMRNTLGMEVPPMAVGVKDSALTMFPLSDVPYEDWRVALRSLVAGGMRVVGTVTEAWVVAVSGASEVAAYEAARALGVPNAEHPDRVEVLQVLCESADAQLCWQGKIVDGKVGDPEVTTDVGGRLANLFEPTPALDYEPTPAPPVDYEKLYEKILDVVPASEAALRADLEKARTSMRYTPPENIREVATRLMHILVTAVGKPEAPDSWQAKVQAAWNAAHAPKKPTG